MKGDNSCWEGLGSGYGSKTNLSDSLRLKLSQYVYIWSHEEYALTWRTKWSYDMLIIYESTTDKKLYHEWQVNKLSLTITSWLVG